MSRDIDNRVEFNTNTNAAYRCPLCGGRNCEFDDADNTPAEGYFDGAHLQASFYCNDCGKPYTMTFTLRVEGCNG